MCVDCGCEHDQRLRTPAAMAAQGGVPRVKTKRVSVEQGVLAKNDAGAARNRARLASRGVLALNLLSSPGAGKTTLLERTIKDLGAELSIAVIEGDQATDNDARRIRAAGCRAVQINTGTGCHLDADMVARGLDELEPIADGATVLIENVGNLVCPALFDLGEQAKVVVASVAEGEDKPLKYPHMFRAASVIVLNKVDLLPHVDFDVARFVECARRVNATAPILQLSATRGVGTAGLASWYDWLRASWSARARASREGVGAP